MWKWLISRLTICNVLCYNSQPITKWCRMWNEFQTSFMFLRCDFRRDKRNHVLMFNCGFGIEFLMKQKLLISHSKMSCDEIDISFDLKKKSSNNRILSIKALNDLPYPKFNSRLECCMSKNVGQREFMFGENRYFSHVVTLNSSWPCTVWFQLWCIS